MYNVKYLVCIIFKDHEKNNEVLNVLGEYYMIGTDEMWEKINNWDYNYDTATYLLLLNRHKQGLPLKIIPQSRLRYRIKVKINDLEVNVIYLNVY